MRRTPLILALAATLLGAAGAAAPAADDEPAARPELRPIRPIRPTLPLRVQLTGEAAADGTVVLVATVQVGARLAADPVLRLALPEGARLVEGAAEETLPRPAPGATVERRFVVAGARSVQVTVTAGAAAGGATAAATWPAAPTAPAVQRVPPRTERITPVRLPGVTIRRSVPLRPAPVAPVAPGTTPAPAAADPAPAPAPEP